MRQPSDGSQNAGDPRAGRPGAERRTFRVVGMTCDHCVRAVREEVGRLPGVTAVAVDLESGTVEVESSAGIDDAAVATAVDEAGYEVRP